MVCMCSQLLQPSLPLVQGFKIALNWRTYIQIAFLFLLFIFWFKNIFVFKKDIFAIIRQTWPSFLSLTIQFCQAIPYLQTQHQKQPHVIWSSNYQMFGRLIHHSIGLFIKEKISAKKKKKRKKEEEEELSLQFVHVIFSFFIF